MCKFVDVACFVGCLAILACGVAFSVKFFWDITTIMIGWWS
jgi:hypothetical protein